MKRETNLEGGLVGGASGLGPRPVRCKPTTTTTAIAIATRRREPAARQLFPPEAGSTPEQEHADSAAWLDGLQDAFLDAHERHYGVNFRLDPAEGPYALPPAAAAAPAAPLMMANNHDNSDVAAAAMSTDAPNGLPAPEPLLFTTHPTTSCEDQTNEDDPFSICSTSRTDAATWSPSARSSPSEPQPSTPSRRS
jgi:hypothetical protein